MLSVNISELAAEPASRRSAPLSSEYSIPDPAVAQNDLFLAIYYTQCPVV